jgi:radical SAM protein with 4Fe4S-binding SPASM domain
MTFREQGHAEHFFWHCDEAEETIPDMQGYLHMYRQALEKIMGVFVEFLGRGDLLSIVHVNELLLYLLTGAHRGASACGVERMANFDIIGDGKIHGCADLPQAMSIGTFTADGGVQFDPDARERLAGLVSYKEELGCAECGVEPYCGGRCPVQIHTGGLERARQYCYVVRQHVRTVKRHAPDIVDRMLEHGMTLEHLYRSARYAKFTDVMP